MPRRVKYVYLPIGKKEKKQFENEVSHNTYFNSQKRPLQQEHVVSFPLVFVAGANTYQLPQRGQVP
jgi:hypothetical protein